MIRRDRRYGISIEYLYRSVIVIHVELCLRWYQKSIHGVPRAGTTIGRRSFVVAGPSLWNSLPAGDDTAHCQATTQGLSVPHLMCRQTRRNIRHRPALSWRFYRTALNAGRSSQEKAVCPSVRLSVPLSNACIVTKGKKYLSKFFIPYERSFSLVFWEQEWLVGATPSTWTFGSPPVRAKSPILNPYLEWRWTCGLFCVCACVLLFIFLY